MWVTTERGEEYQSLDLRDTKFSYIESKITSKEETAKQCVAAPEKKGGVEEESEQYSAVNAVTPQAKSCRRDLTTSPG